ncbi:MAG: RidA family protein [Helicobacter sp.]|uniref:RidA family protein n=1 Tax=Helicobacter sp. 10-6591 TaxID=2004998 RepID=UPI000DCBA534|nr:RidA family protein [Helicobacter sp. 10-6591]MCI6217840.1 RidA family protein [Helicobacter sp.]MCI7484776.1 RidA family protein [Helicobacter sp.]MDD7567015.1 RidA family protein [Helicobacter sp.]MDY5741216.1 RidA family protein [Helicobacter sp.]RAX56268.1 deaminase [Helicobacter sp. 10-6591]
MQIIHTQNAPQAIGPYSQAIKSGGFIFASGQIALDSQNSFPHTDIREQTIQVLKNLQAILESQGSSLQKVIKTTIFLTDMDNFGIVNEVYAEFFGPHKPARSTIGVKELPRGALVEIECIALD